VYVVPADVRAQAIRSLRLMYPEITDEQRSKIALARKQLEQE
jgi:hypothetical protein